MSILLTRKRSGTSAGYYIHNQIVLDDQWVIVHNLGRRCAVFCYGADDYVFIPKAIYYDDDNQITIDLAEPATGWAYLI
jgi:hypothetical protein